MAGSFSVEGLLLVTAITAIQAAPHQYSAFPAMACGNMLSKNNENLCRSFNGGSICVWDPHVEPKCRIGRDTRGAGVLFARSLTQLEMPMKPYNTFTVINAAKIFAVKAGKMQMQRRAEEHERWLRHGKSAFDKSPSPQCLVNVPLCHRVKCGDHSSQTNASHCLSDPQCCFDRSLYQYQYSFGSEFMGGAPTCYYGASSVTFREVSALMKPWSPWYSSALFDLFKEELMKPITVSGMLACSVADPMTNTCGWEGISKAECRLKDCCFTSHNTCVYPQKAVIEKLKVLGSYPELNTDVEEEAQCSANPFVNPSIYKRIPCQRLSSDLYSVLSCSADCCMDRNSISLTLQTNGYLSNPQSRGRTPYPTNTQPHQQNHYPPHTNIPRQPQHIPQMMTQQPQNSHNPWNGMAPITPDLMNMVSTIMSTNANNPSNNPTTVGDPAVNLMMQVMGGAPSNPSGPMSIPNPSGLSGGLLEFYLKNGGQTSVPSGRRSLKPGSDTMMDAYMAGLLGGHNSQFGQSLNPNMLYLLLNSKENGKGLDINKMLQLGILPFGQPTQSGQTTNPYLLSTLLGENSGDMSDAMKYALMQSMGNGGNNMATAMLMSNLFKGDGSEKNDNNKFLMMSLLSNLMNKGRSNQYQNSPYAYSNRRSYQQNPPPPPPQAAPQRQHFNIPFPAPGGHQHQGYQKAKYPSSDMALVDQVLMSKRVDGVTLPYCPYNFVKIGHFPDLSGSINGCCKVFACYRTKQMKAPAPFQQPTYGPWGAWSLCDKTCGTASYRNRFRRCNNGQPDAICQEPTRQFDKCKLGPCQLNGESQQNDMIAGPRKGGASLNSKPRNRQDLTSLMDKLLDQMDNPVVLPNHFPDANTGPHIPAVPPTVPTHASQTTPTTYPPGPASGQNGGQPSKWRMPDQQTTVDRTNDAYGPWSTWSICDRDCGGGRMIRMRLCSSNTGSCGNSREETTICNTHSCENSTDVTIDPASPLPDLFAIPVPSNSPPAPFPSILPSIPSPSDKLPPISESPQTRYVYGSWSLWSLCRNSGPVCTGDGVRTRQRNCFTYMDDGITPIPQKNCKDSVQIDPCSLSCGGQNLPESSTSTVPVTPSEKPPPVTTTSPEDVDMDIPSNGNWSNWSECKGPCGENQGVSKRQRKCVTAVNDPFCDTEGLVLKAKRSCTVQC